MAREQKATVPGAPSLPSGQSGSKGRSKGKKQSTQQQPPSSTESSKVNGHHAPAHAYADAASTAQALEERAEKNAAVAAVDILETKQAEGELTGHGSGVASSAVARALAKRVKAITKKLQRISQYEDLPPNNLNEDQKKAIASKPTQQAILKELQEVAKALEQADKEREAELQAKAQAEAQAKQQDALAEDDNTWVILQQILRLFTLLHVPQITPSFAPTASSTLLSSITGQEAAAIGQLYQDIIERDIRSSAPAAGDDTNLVASSAQHCLELVARGASEEILAGVTYARVQELIARLSGPDSSAEAAPRPPQADEDDLARQENPAVENELKDDEKAQDVAETAPELVEAADTNNEHGDAYAAQSAPAGGISFLQSSEVGQNNNDGNAPASALEPEGGVVDAAPTLSGERSSAGQEAARGAVLGQEPGGKQSAKIDWSADLDEDDDLGDPLDAFPDQQRPAAAAGQVKPAAEAVVAPLQNGSGTEPQTPPLSSRQSADPMTTASKAAGAKNQNGSISGRGAAANAPTPGTSQSEGVTATKKGPVVDEDGFVLQTSKRSLHQQAQAAARGSGGRGRGRGRGAPRGGANTGSGNGSGNNRAPEGTTPRGRGRGRGAARTRGGADGAVESS
ncbi:unnamed protein product [Parajaminaea phylloscopi]